MRRSRPIFQSVCSPLVCTCHKSDCWPSSCSLRSPITYDIVTGTVVSVTMAMVSIVIVIVVVILGRQGMRDPGYKFVMVECLGCSKRLVCSSYCCSQSMTGTLDSLHILIWIV